MPDRFWISSCAGAPPSLACSLVLLFSWSTAAQEPNRPLHELIDEHVSAPWKTNGTTPAALADDAEFLRRIYLDLTGSVPSTAEARTFLDQPAPDQRTALIDKLLASPEFARHMSRVFDVTLMERRPDKHVPANEWREFLRIAFAEKKPWDQLVREILSSDGADPKTRAAAKFFLDRDAEPTVLTKDLTRMFLGMNYQCAQCHDHPLVSDYAQEHYYGIYAFVSRSYLFTDKKNKNLVSLAEKADGDVKFKSVFDKTKTEHATGPRILAGPPIAEPKFDKGQEYAVAPADGVKPVPKFSRRAQLASLLAVPTNTPFNRNIANRLWAHMMGRGLVQPLDLDNSDNPPSHPELIELLASQFVAMKYDVRALLRELALSQTYQRASWLPETAGELPPERFAVALIKPLSPEQLAWSMMQATGVTDSACAALADKCTEQTLHDRLAGNVNEFVATFAGAPGEPDVRFQASLDQALFLSNGGLVRGWLVPGTGNLADRLVKLFNAEQFDAVADELYFSVLTRRATPDECAEIAEYLKPRAADRAVAIQELIWALLTSSEFRFNH